MTDDHKAEAVRHEAGLSAARRFAGWHIGDRSWADLIIEAYLNPERVERELDDDDVPQITGSFR